jgi:transposase
MSGLSDAAPRVNDVVLAVDYHDGHCVIRRRNLATDQESVRKIDTDPHLLGTWMRQAADEAQLQAGRAVWIQESTTGWARMAALADECGVEFVLANVLQMPLPPKARRRKTDKVDTARLLREYLNGQLPRSHQPRAEWRQLRRVVALRESLVRRRTALTNWVDRYLAHETWADRQKLWTRRGLARLRALSLPETDRQVIAWKLQEWEQIASRLKEVESLLLTFYRQSPDAQRLDEIRGLAPVSSISIVARIGPIGRFQSAEQLIAFAGLSPGVRQSDDTCRSGKIGGGGTDKCLRHYIIEATFWVRDIPRYRDTYQRVLRRRGVKVARLVVARLLLRSIHKMLSTGVAFQPRESRRRDPVEPPAQVCETQPA